MSAYIFPRFLLTLALMMTSLSVFADTGYSQSSGPANGSTVLTHKKESIPIERMPSCNQLDLVYENGMLSIFSDSYAGEFSLSFVDIDTAVSYEVYLIKV